MEYVLSSKDSAALYAALEQKPHEKLDPWRRWVLPDELSFVIAGLAPSFEEVVDGSAVQTAISFAEWW